jgi:hypothetical protein
MELTVTTGMIAMFLPTSALWSRVTQEQHEEMDKLSRVFELDCTLC